MLKLFNKKSKYVIWDGVTKQKYFEDSIYNDCLVMHNMELQSVQEVRNIVIAEGAVPTIIFACKKGQSAHEIEINGRWNGAFSYYYTCILGTPKLTYKDAISKINEHLIATVDNQMCEIVCREDVLEMEMNLDSIKGKKHCLMVFDMCRG